MKITKVCRVNLTKEEMSLAEQMEILFNEMPDKLKVGPCSVEDLREAMVALECSDDEPLEYEA